MKKISVIFCLLLFLCVALISCEENNGSQIPRGTVDATEYGVSVDNTGEENSRNLQKLIDCLSKEGGTVYIPAGEYEFAENGTQTIGSHCIKMKSNVNIIGDGEDTVLKPVGESRYGLDMFYFNEYLDTGKAVYLENCRFENFTIDAEGTSLKTYTSAGKGFMFNLFRNCQWNRVTVKNTDATGFGVDCPIDSSITGCTAIACGKAANDSSGGASGFGIGFGYTDGEGIVISHCHSQGNKKFGFFFEHQGRFSSEKYSAYELHDFNVSDCTASENLYNFGGICALNVSYMNCSSQAARQYGFYFENSIDSGAVSCISADEADTSFVILQSDFYKVEGVYFDNCAVNDAPYGVKILSDGTATVSNNKVKNCVFSSICAYTVYTSGGMHSLTLVDNVSDLNTNLLPAGIVFLENSKNSWNQQYP